MFICPHVVIVTLKTLSLTSDDIDINITTSESVKNKSLPEAENLLEQILKIYPFYQYKMLAV
jgi:hypothetical protein